MSGGISWMASFTATWLTPQDRHSTTTIAAAIVVVLCLSWGVNQVAVKLAIHDIPPLIQSTVRSIVATLVIVGWCRLRAAQARRLADPRARRRILFRH